MSIALADRVTDVAVIDKIKMTPPRLWHVILLNDNKTTMELVVLVLMQVFHKSFEDAQDIMMNIHESGRGVAGSYTHEIATTKRDDTITLARKNNSPLQCKIEPAE